MAYYFAWLIIFLLPLMSFASNENIATGARSAAMGNVGVVLDDAFSVFNNQAGLTGVKKVSTGICSEKRFLVSGVNLHGALAAIPTNSGVFGIGLSYFGFDLYNEKKVGLAFAKALGEKFSMGVQLDYLSTYISEYGSKSAVTFEGGILAKVTKELKIGAHIYNPLRVKMGVYREEKLPTIMKIGLAYQPSQKIIFALETEKDIDLKPVVKAGIDYKIVEKFSLRGGISTNPINASFGFGVNLKKIKIDFSSSFHQQLGYTPKMGLTYVFE